MKEALRSAKSRLRHPSAQVKGALAYPISSQGRKGGSMPLAQGKTSQRCCVTHLTLNQSAFLLQLKSWLSHPWAARDRFKSPIPIQVSYAVLQEKAAKAELE